MDIIAISKLIIDAIRELRTAIGGRKRKQRCLVELTGLLELYAWTEKVRTLSFEITLLLNRGSSTLDEADLNLFNRFQTTVYDFVRCLDTINRDLIGIYTPKAALRIEEMLHRDLRLLDIFVVRIAEQNHIDLTKLWPTLKSLRRLLSTRSSIDGRTTKELTARSDDASALQQVQSLANASEECRALIAEVIRNNWSFRDAAALSKQP